MSGLGAVPGEGGSRTIAAPAAGAGAVAGAAETVARSGRRSASCGGTSSFSILCCFCCSSSSCCCCRSLTRQGSVTSLAGWYLPPAPREVREGAGRGVEGLRTQRQGARHKGGATNTRPPPLASPPLLPLPSVPPSVPPSAPPLHTPLHTSILLLLTPGQRLVAGELGRTPER